MLVYFPGACWEKPDLGPGVACTYTFSPFGPCKFPPICTFECVKGHVFNSDLRMLNKAIGSDQHV